MRRRFAVAMGILLILLALTGCNARTASKTDTGADSKPQAATETKPEAKTEAKTDNKGAAPAAQPAQPAQPQGPAFTQEPTAFPGAKIQVDPAKGTVGSKVTVSGTGFPAGEEIDLHWKTFDGRWVLEEDEVVFVGPRYEAVFEKLPKVKADGSGSFKLEYTVPEDFGGVHDVYASIKDKFAARNAFNLTPSFSVEPTSGPIGTPVTVRAKGIGYRQQLAQWHVAWDNGYTGYMTAVNTRGSATAYIRLAGPAGKHVLKIWRNYRGIPYLNPHQGPFGPLPESTFIMDVTEGVYQAPAIYADPKPEDTVRPAPEAKSAGGAKLTVTPAKGTVGSKITLQGEGFPGNQPVKLTWSSRTGQQITATGLREGFEELITEIPGATAGPDGKFTKEMTVFDDFEGNHRITAENGDKKSEAYYAIYASIVEFPLKVKVGEEINIRMKGVGWNIQGKTYAIVYNNKYLGYGCSFSTRGDIDLRIPAAGGPGVHIIDLYPAVYEGKDPTPDVYSNANLTYRYDHPGSTLPAFRLTLTVTE